VKLVIFDFGQRKRLPLFAFRQLVTEKQELRSSDLKCGKDWLHLAVRNRSDA